MTRILLVLFLTLAGVSAAWAAAMDDLTATVVFLRSQRPATETRGGEELELWYRYPGTDSLVQKMNATVGTGFIVTQNDRDYLVTAKHVAKLMPQDAKIVMNLPSGGTTAITFGWIAEQIKGARWFHHPTADISIHPMCYPTEVRLTAVPEALFPNRAREIPLLATVYILGFPLGLGAGESLSPLAREAKVASGVTSVDHPAVSSEPKFILLDEALSQGYSGAPVYCIEDVTTESMIIGGQPVKVGQTIQLIGIVSSTLSDVTGGKISLIAPTSYLWDIFKSDAVSDYRQGLGSD